MPHINSVLSLRTRELAHSTREFKARGYKAIRCQWCLLPQQNCICEERVSIKKGTTSNCAFCFVMYQGEYYKPSNTGRIIADLIMDNYAFRWHRVDPEPELLGLLNHPKYAPILVFPQQYADPARCIASPSESELVKHGKTPLFIMLDGTWREAKKMFKSPIFAKLPVLGIEPEQPSSYQLREAAHKHQLCTAEVAIEILTLAQEQQAAAALNEYFQIFKAAYIRGKAHLTLA